jgi:hypothetical protein
MCQLFFTPPMRRLFGCCIVCRCCVASLLLLCRCLAVSCLGDLSCVVMCYGSLGLRLGYGEG